MVPVVSVSTPQTRDGSERDVYEVMVKKIYPGSAVVLINDKWRARMTPQDFEGPADMIKKDASFKARGTLYRDGNTLCFRVRHVTQIMS
jgi:Fanconi anemia group M protein